jgi:diaminohydroxyphosphoribosylaminopyrimidine deaminase/5-amino-6-(5-phosphoribosylamino)uracil reductase
VLVVTLRGQAARRRRLEARGVTVLETVGKGGQVALKGALMSLWKHGLRSLMVEGGGEVLGSFLSSRLFDEVALFRAPLLLGGAQSVPAFGGPSPRRLRDALRLDGPRLPGVELWYPRP